MRTVATTPEIERAIADLIERLQKGIRVEAVVLYGSYALGNPDEWSDIDIAIVSPDFEGLPLSQRQEMISRFSVHRYPRLSPIGYPSSEYRQPRRDSFLTEILRSGKVVYRAKGSPHRAATGRLKNKTISSIATNSHPSCPNAFVTRSKSG